MSIFREYLVTFFLKNMYRIEHNRNYDITRSIHKTPFLIQFHSPQAMTVVVSIIEPLIIYYAVRFVHQLESIFTLFANKRQVRRIGFLAAKI